jgi:hypothetical protein
MVLLAGWSELFRVNTNLRASSKEVFQNLINKHRLQCPWRKIYTGILETIFVLRCGYLHIAPLDS